MTDYQKVPRYEPIIPQPFVRGRLTVCDTGDQETRVESRGQRPDDMEAVMLGPDDVVALIAYLKAILARHGPAKYAKQRTRKQTPVPQA